jgi:hypothetical protein
MELAELVELGDPAAIALAVDGLTDRRDWAGLVELRARLEDAVERGRPLWPMVTWVEYRIALEAPGAEAAAVLRPGAGRFALGPLTEVAAQNHAWSDLAPHLQSPAVAGVVAQERVLRGEDLRSDPRAGGDILELPLVLHDWEPDYPLPVYRSDRLVTADPPDLPEPRAVELPSGDAARLGRGDAERALLDLVEVWTSESEGVAAAAVVAGGPADAVAAAATVDTLRLARVHLDDALGLMSWAAGSGGAHGVRRGGALARFDTWWAAAALAGQDWPADPDRLGDALERLEWFVWDDGGPATGWVLRLAVADRDGGWAAALDARDASADPGRRRAGPADQEDE